MEGAKNNVDGAVNQVNGAQNEVSGVLNHVEGEGNHVYGSGNVVTQLSREDTDALVSNLQENILSSVFRRFNGC